MLSPSRIIRSQQIKPSEISSISKSIKLNDNLSIHVLHLNERKFEKNGSGSFFPSSQEIDLIGDHVETSQPKRLNETKFIENLKNHSETNEYLEHKTKASPINSELLKNSQKFASSVVSVNEHETFTNLLESGLFKSDKYDGLFKAQFDKYSIIYKNKIASSAKGDPYCRTPLIFFVHGVGGNINIWKNQIGYFSNLGYEVVAIDLIGHGKSTVPDEQKNYEFLEMAANVLNIFDMFATTDQNVLIGHSYGCSFCIYIAQSRKNIVKKLILISGGSPHPLGIFFIYLLNHLFKSC
jgi:hypothetical protein